MIGKRIRQARKAQGLSQVELSKMVGVLRTSLTNIESGRVGTTIDLLLKLLPILKVDTHWLLTGDETDQFKEIKPALITSEDQKLDRIIGLLEDMK